MQTDWTRSGVDFRDEEDGSVAEDVSMSSMPCYDLLSVREKKVRLTARCI